MGQVRERRLPYCRFLSFVKRVLLNFHLRRFSFLCRLWLYQSYLRFLLRCRRRLHHWLTTRLLQALLQRAHNIKSWQFFNFKFHDLVTFYLRFDKFFQSRMVIINRIYLFKVGHHFLHQSCCKFQFVLIQLLRVLNLRHVLHLSQFVRIVKLLQDQTVFVWKHCDQILAIPQHDFANADFASLLHHFTQQRVRLLRDGTVGTGVIRSVIESCGDLVTVDKTHDVDGLRGFDLYLCDIFRLDDRVAVRFILVAFSDLIVGNDLPTFLATLVVANRTVVFPVQLIELDLFACFKGVVNADRNGDQQKAYMTLPNRSHIERLLMRTRALSPRWRE